MAVPRAPVQSVRVKACTQEILCPVQPPRVVPLKTLVFMRRLRYAVSRRYAAVVSGPPCIEQSSPIEIVRRGLTRSVSINDMPWYSLYRKRYSIATARICSQAQADEKIAFLQAVACHSLVVQW